MKIFCIYGYNFDSNIYVILGKNPTIIDCGTGLYENEVFKKLNKIVNLNSINQIILTHEHYDHCGGVKKIYEKTNNNPKIISHVNASDKIENGKSQFAQMLGGEMPKMPVDIKLNDKDIINAGDETFEILHTPGHTPGCICLYDKSSKSLISGDTVFSHGSFGRYDFPGGSLIDLKKSIERLAELDIENLYPGHESYITGDGNKHIKMTLRNISNIF
jgi:glyoxylase-like metal-dependent hydrolase (beta-lactamase superfamily II)